MNLINWTPFGETDDVYDRFFSNAFRPSSLRLLGADVQWRPAADIFETEKEYSIKLDLPEVKKKDVDVRVSDDILTIKGERRMQKETEDEKQHRRESYYGSFSRSFSLPENIDEKRIKAPSKDGVLRIVLPKTKEKRAEPIEINVQQLSILKKLGLIRRLIESGVNRINSRSRVLICPASTRRT